MPREVRTVTLVRQAERELRAAFARQVASLRRSVSLRDLEAELATGGLGRVLDRLDRAVGSLGESWIESFTRGAGAGARAAGTVFDRLAPAALDELRRNQFRLVNAVRASQRVAAIRAVGDVARRQGTLQEQARALRDSLGLTDVQARSLETYRAALAGGEPDPRVPARARRSSQPLSRGQVDELTERYRERLLARRASTVAEVEARGATYGGVLSALEQAVAGGDLDGDSVRRAWVTQEDERVRGSHRTMSGQVRALDEPFVSGAGNRLMHPGDADAPASETANCRCSLVTVLVEEGESL